MGIAKKDITIAQQFNKDVERAFQKFSGQNVIVLGDFNAKFGKKYFAGGPIGSHARRIRNENGKPLNDWLAKIRMFSSITLFKHKACNITTWKGFIKNRKVLSQINYINLQNNPKHPVLNAGSHQIFSVDTDQRLVTTEMLRKNDWERARNKPGSTTTNPTFTLLQWKYR